MRIGVIGEFNGSNRTHVATDAALDHSARALEIPLQLEWLPTDGSHDLSRFNGLWCSPGSPYRSLDGALRGLEFARKGGIPLIGTCGGFQHIVLEYAKNVMGIADAAHEEYDPYASNLFLSRLSCSLVGKTMSVGLLPGSLAYRAYGEETVEENYYCNFGLNREHEEALVEAGLSVTGREADGEPRIIELPGHPFYVGTLFVPQVKSTADSPHPLVSSFVLAAQEASKTPMAVG